MTREEATRTMVADPTTWGQFPYLPMKRGDWMNDDEGLGIIFNPVKVALNPETFKPIVRIANLLFAPHTMGEIEKLQKFEYDSIEAMIADGWVVD